MYTEELQHKTPAHTSQQVEPYGRSVIGRQFHRPPPRIEEEFSRLVVHQLFLH
jgi:hypothetical protein